MAFTPQEMDHIDTAIEQRLNPTRRAIESLDKGIRDAKQAAVGTQRGLDAIRRNNPGYDVAGLTKLLVAAVRAKVGRFGLDDYLAANANPLAGRFRTLIAEGKAMQFRAVTNPAMVSVPDWAGVLASGKTLAPLAALALTSAYSQLMARPSVMALDFDGIASISMPARTPGDLAGGFHSEASPLAVKKGALTSSAIGPFSFGVISTFTREMSKGGSFEQFLKAEIAYDSALALDTAFLSDDAATSISPAGLLANAPDVTASTETVKQDACAEDLSNLASAIPAAVDLVYISTAEVRARAMIYAGAGIASLPWIVSPQAPADAVVAIDAGSLAMAESGFSFDVSEDAAYHESDAPLPISTGASGAGAITAAPVRSMWQTAVIGIRLFSFISWGLRGSGRVAIVEDIAW